MADKKTIIIEATISAIAKYGLNKTNAQVIAKELNIAQSSIFYHFPQQQQLFDSLIEHIAKVNNSEVKALLQTVNANNNFDRICHYIKGNLQWAVSHRDHVTVLLYSLAEGKYNDKIGKGITKILKTAEDKFYLYLVSGIAEGEFTVSGNLRSLAQLINQSVNGSVVTHFHLHNDWNIDIYMRELTLHLKEIIHLNNTP
tara:strand:- start:280 stop:876 length:597 start_codon:yes stop_codon:yes gene_type:complete